MIRVLRYPRMFYTICMLTMGCAVLRDYCMSASLTSFAHVLLVVTVVLLLLCLGLMSCRFFVDVQGVGVGFLFRVRRTNWEDIAAFGLVCCNSKRQYFYGMYRGSTDFLNMLHHAPACGPWGFVVPVSKKLLAAICEYCPFAVNLAAVPKPTKEGRLRMQWHHAVLYAMLMLPAAAVAFATGALMLSDAMQTRQLSTMNWATLGAVVLLAAGVQLVRKAISTCLTCPAFSEHGVCAGAGLYLPWEDVHFGYVHRIGRMSGMFLLSQPLEALVRSCACRSSCSLVIGVITILVPPMVMVIIA